MHGIKIHLFIAGMTPAARRAISNMERICAQLDDDKTYSIAVTDIIENPDAADENRILATPTAIKELPPPIRKLVGDLSDQDQVLAGLDLEQI